MNWPTKKELLEAAERIRPHLTQTPILYADEINSLLDAKVGFKCENLQRTGSFKARGAVNACSIIASKKEGRIVATHSSGNHGKALAWASKLFHFEAHIAVPETAPEIKRKAIESLGAHIHPCGPSQYDRETELTKILDETNAFFVPPFEHPYIIAGQSTCVQEIVDQAPQTDIVFVPVGGGGLSAGSALALKHFKPKTDLILCEPSSADDAYQSLKSDQHLTHDGLPNTIADGLRTNIGVLNLDILRKNSKEIYTCSEESILGAMRMIWDHLKIICEPSSAVPLAAIIENRIDIQGKNVVIILSGGNVRADFWA